MREIKIFLASSINEFKIERNAIGDFIRKLQDKLIDYDIYLDLFECEFYDNTMTKEARTQLVYDDIARKSDLFFMLVGKRIGEFTLEEYMEVREIDILEKHVILYGDEHDESVLKLQEILKQDTFTNVVETYDLKDILDVFKEVIEKKLDYQFVITIDGNKIKLESNIK